MRYCGTVALVLVLAMLTAAPPVHAQKRVALVIGNSAYQHTGKLANPKNDAIDMAAALKKLGFQVVDGFDLDKAAFDRKVRDFAAALQGAEAGLFFFAGHGLQVAGHNYLVPVDAELKTASTLDFEMVRLDVVQRVMEHETNTNILFLDACRDNPLARNLARALGTRSGGIGRGFAPVVSGVGTLISFSTQPGNVALDGTGRNSPFAGALTKRLAAPKDDLSAMLIDVRNDVMQETQNKQVPWEHSALRGRFYFKTATQIAVQASDLPIGARPSAHPLVQADGLFGEREANRLRALANKHHLPLPDFQIEVPDGSVPATLRRFVGVWFDPEANARKVRTVMMIVTSVDREGRADGFWIIGPPGANSFDQFPPSAFRIAGTITDDGLRFSNPPGNATYKHRLRGDGRMDFVFSTSKGQIGTAVLVPVWALVEAERTSKR